MKFIKLQKESYTIISAIFFSILIHFAAGVILVFGLSTNLNSTLKINGIKYVWISFDDKRVSGDMEIENSLSTQSPPAIKMITEKPANIETPARNQESIQISTVKAGSMINNIELAKDESFGIISKEKSYIIEGENTIENTYKKSDLNMAIAYPLYKENSPPVYPEIARVRGYEGIVLVFAEILPNGRVGEVKIRKSSGYAILDQSAIQAVKPWKFEPAKKSGNPFTAWVELPIKFILHNNS
jgi:TonB family protein